MATRHKLIDELLKEYQTSEDFFGKDGLLKQLTKDLVECILQAELTDHLGYERHAAAGNRLGNSRNGTRRKTPKGDQAHLVFVSAPAHFLDAGFVYVPKREPSALRTKGAERISSVMRNACQNSKAKSTAIFAAKETDPLLKG